MSVADLSFNFHSNFHDSKRFAANFWGITEFERAHIPLSFGRANHRSFTCSDFSLVYPSFHSPEDMAHVLPGLFVPAHISKVLPIVPTHPPHSDCVDWLGYEDMRI